MSEKLSATIEVGLDGSKVQDGVAPIARTLENLGKTAKKAGRDAGEGLGSVGEETSKATAKVDSATKNLVSSTERAIARLKAELEGGSKSHSKFLEVLATQRGVNMDVLNPYLVKLKEIEKAQADAAKTTGNLGISAAQTAAALRSVPAQFTDIITSLQGGQAPLTVFLQQGGQLKDMFGGAGNAAKALGGYVLGLVNPFTIAAGAAAALGAAYFQGSKEAQEYQKALILTGNAAGATAGQMQDIAREIAATGKTTQSAAAEAVVALASTGNIGASSLQKFADVAVQMQKTVGKSVTDTAKDLSELGKSPYEASIKLNEQYRYLTPAILSNIKALTDQGRASEAAALAQNTYADTMAGRTRDIKENLGTIEQSWNSLKGTAAKAWDAMLNVGRKDTESEQIERLKRNIKEREQALASTYANSTVVKVEQQKLLDADKTRLKVLQDQEAEQRKQAEAQKKIADTTSATNAWLDQGKQFLTKQKQLELEIKEIRNAGKAAGIDEKEIEDRVALAKASEKYKESISKEETAYQSLVKAINQRLTLSGLELNSEKPLSEAQKLRVKLMEAVELSHGKLTKAQILEQAKKIDLIRSNELLRDSYVNLDRDLGKLKLLTAGDLVADINRQDQAFSNIIRTQEEYRQSLEDSNSLAQLELSLLGQSATDRGIIVEQYKIELELQKQIRAIKAQNLDAGQQQFAIDEANSNANIAKSQAYLKVQQQEWTKFYGDIYNGLTDSLYRGFEAGKGFFQSFWDGIKNLFKTTVLKLAVQGVMTGVLGLSNMGQANAMQAMGQSGTDPMSMISAGKSMYEGFVSGFSGFGNSVANYVQAGLDKAGLSMSGGGNSAFAIGAGTAASYLGGAAVGVYGGRALSGGYSVTGGNAAVNIGTIAGAIFGGPIGAAIGGLIGGGVNRVFGRKAAELQSSTLSGSIGADGFAASTRDVYMAKGGLFRSDKWSETNTPMGDTGGLTAQYEAIKAAATGYASMLGLSASTIESYTKAFSFSLSKTGDAAKDAEENNKKLAELFVGISDDITNLLAPSISSLAKEGETASQTLQRLATGLTDVNAVMKSVGFAEFAKSLEGSNAATRLAELTGGIEKLAGGAQYFFENFLTDAEKIKPSADLVTETMKRLGQSSVDTIDEFKMLVQGLDLATESGAKMYAELIAIAPQFKAVADYTKETVKASETYVDVQFNAQRKVEAAAIAATQALEAQARATMELAKAEKQKTYDDALQSRLRSGKIGEIMSSNYELNPVDFGKYVSGGQFDAAGFNSEILRKQAKLSLELIAKASADAINVEDVALVVGGLFDFTKGNEFRQILRQQLPQGTGLANDVGYVMFDFIESALEGIRLDKYAASGQGVINVINARDQIGYQTDLLTQYNRSLSSAGEALRLGIVTQDEYTGAIAKANEILKDQVKTQDELATSLKQAGIDSIAFYFDQIGLSVERLNQAAEKAAEPLAVVTSAIGRFTSVSDVFSLSANAAGGDANAELVAQSAKIAAQVLTTQSAAQAAKELAEKAAFSGASSTQLRDYSLLIEGVKQFDPNSFEAGFLRISDALNKGTIDQAQYQDLFSVSLDMFKGVESESSLLAKTMGTLREAMTSFADSLLIDKSKTTLSDAARMQEVMRQYDQAKIGAMAGDANAISQFQSLGAQLASRENYSSRAEANYGFSRVLADSQLLSRYAERDASAPQVAAIKELEKTISDRFDKQFSIMRSQLLELQGARTEAARKNLPTTGVTA